MAGSFTAMPGRSLSTARGPSTSPRDLTRRNGWELLLDADTGAFTATDDVALILTPSTTAGVTLREDAREIDAHLAALGSDGRDSPHHPALD
jgi:hypothetical protein